MADSTAQHTQALEKANANRIERARQLDGMTTERLAAVVEEVPTPAWAETLEVGKAIMRIHRWGRTRMVKFLAPVWIGEAKTIGTLTDRQRRVLAEALRALS